MRKKLKRTFTSFVAVIILVTTLLSGAMFTVTAQGEKAMYNLYLYPDLSSIKGGTTGKIRTYSISFCANDANPAPGTFWTLANFGFTNLDSKENSNKQTTGGYAGLQKWDRFHDNQSAAILSIFQKKITTDGSCAKCMYNTYKIIPSSNPAEPSCINTSKEYTWYGNRWYRMVLHCWDYYDSTNKNNPSNGNTCIGMWIQDIATRQWTLFSYYDTKLKNSVMTGDMHFFLENPAPLEANNTRKYKINGIYAKDASDDSWKSITSAEQKYTCGENGAIGTPSFSRDNNYSYFWGNITPQNSNLALNPLSQTRKTAITQPSTPSFGTQKTNKSALKCEASGTNLKVSWTPDPTSTPQLSYEVNVYDQSGNCVRTVKQTRPDAKSCTINNFNLKEYSCSVTVTDVFGNTMTQAYSTQNAVKSISIAKNTNKTTYYIGDSESKNKLDLNVTYGNGTTKKITTDKYTTYGFDSKTKGVKKITVNYGGATAAYNITVKEPSITITNPTSKMFSTDTVALNAVAVPANSKVTWKSSNTYVATVDSNGKLTAKKGGNSTITASINYRGKTYAKSFNVEVTEPRLKWNFHVVIGKTVLVKPGKRIILDTKCNVPGAHTVWYEINEEDKKLGNIVCDTKYYYFEAYQNTGCVRIKAKFRYNGNFIYTSEYSIPISDIL